LFDAQEIEFCVTSIPKKKKKNIAKVTGDSWFEEFCLCSKSTRKSLLLRAWESLLRENFFPWFSNKNILKLVFTYQNY